MKLKNKKVLVTGGAGFIGSHLVDELLKHDNKVVIVDNLTQRCGRNAEYANGKRLKILDITTKRFMKYMLENSFEYIFHLASCSYVPASVKDPYYDCEVNIKGTLNLLESLRRGNKKVKLVFMSSGAVYGEPDKLPISELTPPNPISPYGVSKLSAENYCFAYNKLYGLNIVIARNFSTYGPRQKKQLVYDMLKKMDTKNANIKLFGTGKETRDLIYVKDVVCALIILAERGDENCGIYNIATGKAYHLKAITRLIANGYGQDVKIKFIGKLRKGDPMHWDVNINKIKKLGFRPSYTLEKGIAETVNWFKK